MLISNKMKLWIKKLTHGNYKMVKVSVIIPVYNTEKYLRKCLDSVCNQTLKDIEIICVNDCSTDNSPQILQEYAQKDNRIKIINFTQNKGAAIARNTAIDEAKGEYIGFVDSDDYIDLDFYEKLYAQAEETGADVVKGCYRYNKDGHIEVFINQKIIEDKNNFVCEYCSAIFKKNIIIEHNIRFPHLVEMEDPVFAFSFACVANKIEIVNDAYVNIVTRSGSQTFGIPTQERINDKLNGLSLMLKIANSNPYIKEDSYGYIFALWFNVIANSAMQSKSIQTRQYVAEVIFKLSRQIKFVQNFKTESIKIGGSILIKFLENFDVDNFILFNEKNKIFELSKKIKEHTLTIEAMEMLNNKIVNQCTTKRLKNTKSEFVYLISAVNDYNIYRRCIAENPFVAQNNIKIIDFDNTKNNVSISRRYNSFLNNYDYSQSAWFVFCHCDWEVMEDINLVLKTLDKSHLYGPIGAKANTTKNKLLITQVGGIFEKKRDGTDLRFYGYNRNFDMKICDTFDCQAIIVHSLLIKKYNLRFDEKLAWDLYVEDFCINAKLNHRIDSYVIKIDCCHWSNSGYLGTPTQSYFNSLKYLDSKYSNQIFGGTVSSIGGKMVEKANFKEILLSLARERVANNA